MAAIVALAAPAAAHAGSLSVSGTTLAFTASAGEANHLTIERRSTAFVVTDTGASGLVVGTSGCTLVPGTQGTQATCPLGTASGPVARWTVSLRDKDDYGAMRGATPATMVGGSGNDVLSGGSGNDTLSAQSGDGVQKLTGNGGTDKLVAGDSAGAQTLSGGDGTDELRADLATGPVVLLGGADTDTLVGNRDLQSFCFSCSATNIFRGGPGSDTLVGSGVNDLLDGGPGPDTMRGYGGQDSASYADRTEGVTVTLADGLTNDGGPSDQAESPSTARDLVGADVENAFGGAGADTLLGNSEANMLVGGGSGDQVTGAGGNDTLCGDGHVFTGTTFVFASCGSYFTSVGVAGSDTLVGGDGADWMEGGGGPDTFRGGSLDGTVDRSQRDIVSYSSVGASVRATVADTCSGAVCALANDGPDTSSSAGHQSEGDLVNLDVEVLVGGLYADTLSGSPANNVVFGGGNALSAGNEDTTANRTDTLIGLAGEDMLCGDSVLFSSSFLFGGVTGWAYLCAYNTTTSGGGIDSLSGGSGEDLLMAGDGADVFRGGTESSGSAGENDAVSYADHFTHINSTGVLATIDDLCSSALCAAPNDGWRDVDPATTGNQSEGDRIGPDVESLIGHLGADNLSGSSARSASSTAPATNGANVLIGADGTDVLNGLGGNDLLDPGLSASDTVDGGTGRDLVSYRDTCLLFFASGCYSFQGVTLSLDGVRNDGPVGTPTQQVLGAEGALGTEHSDTLSGHATSASGDRFFGYGGGDVLRGFAGNDLLDGGEGTDTAEGGVDNDYLVSLDGELDSNDCGAGTDRVLKDTSDSSAGCETMEPAAGASEVPSEDAGALSALGTVEQMGKRGR